MYVWWPHIDQDIHSLVQSCTACQEVKQAPPVAPCGTLFGSYLIAVDAHSKWPEVHYMSSTLIVCLKVCTNLSA